jgi:hypothetical protein
MHISVEKQIRSLAHVYLRHGGKGNRRKRVSRLCLACGWIAKEFQINDIRQIGRKQVWAYYAAHSELSGKTFAEYGYAFRLLWELLDREGLPPFPEK